MGMIDQYEIAVYEGRYDDAFNLAVHIMCRKVSKSLKACWAERAAIALEAGGQARLLPEDFWEINNPELKAQIVGQIYQRLKGVA